jgi:hypothetical protein
MKPLGSLIACSILLSGCGMSTRDVAGAYAMRSKNNNASLELRQDFTYEQTVRLQGQVWLTATGKWSFGRIAPRDVSCAGQCVFLEKGFAIEGCPSVKSDSSAQHACKTVFHEVVALPVKKGGQHLGLVQDEPADIIYYKQ